MSQSNIAPRRRAVGLEQRTLAQLTGVRNDVLCRIERGQRPAPPDLLRRLDRVLSVYERAHATALVEVA